MARFYGWSHEQIQGMEADIIEQYWKSINIIESQELLSQISVQTFEHRSKNDREVMHRKLHRDAYPFQKQFVGIQDAARLINGD